MELMESKTLSVAIGASSKTVYSFVSNPENLPMWATAFCRSIKKEGDDWVMTTELGPARVSFVRENEYGILDHFVYPTPDIKVYVPMRVVPNGSGSEVTLTLFKLPDMDEQRFNEDSDLVRRDLNSLKKVVEQKS